MENSARRLRPMPAGKHHGETVRQVKETSRQVKEAGRQVKWKLLDSKQNWLRIFAVLSPGMIQEEGEEC